MVGLSMQIIIQVITAHPNTGPILADTFEENKLLEKANAPSNTIDHNKYIHLIVAF
jgi:hypothetical protein